MVNRAYKRTYITGTVDDETGPTIAQVHVDPDRSDGLMAWHTIYGSMNDESLYVLRDRGSIALSPGQTYYNNEPTHWEERSRGLSMKSTHWNDYMGRILGSDADDTIVGGGYISQFEMSIDDVIDGGAGNDVIYGKEGHDILMGGAGNDRIYGGVGSDAIWGGIGNDVLDGGAHNDLLVGGAGNDTLMSGSGPDTLKGGTGDDLISTQVGGGDGGIDELWGGAGHDTFLITASPDAAANAIDTSTSGSGGITNIFGSPMALAQTTFNFAVSTGLSLAPGLSAAANFFTKAALTYGNVAYSNVTSSLKSSSALTISDVEKTFNRLTTADFAVIKDFNPGDDQLAVKWKTSDGSVQLDYALGSGFATNSGFDIIDRSGNSASVIARVQWGDVKARFGWDSDDKVDKDVLDAYAKSLMDNALVISKDSAKFGDGRLVTNVGDTSKFAKLGTDEYVIVIGNNGGVLDFATHEDKYMFGSDSNDILWGYKPKELTSADYDQGIELPKNFYGFDGDDRFILGAGKAHNVHGGTGIDTIDLRDATRAEVTLRDNVGHGGQGTPGSVVAHFNDTADSPTEGHANLYNVENVSGSDGNDTITGNSQANVLSGLGGNDSISGGGGKDTISGGAGNDTVFGDAGDDVLVSVSGNDELTGGAGADKFVLKGGYARIMDYQAGDSIEIDAAAYPGFTSLFTAFETGGQRVYTVINGTEVNIAMIEGATPTNPLRLSDVYIRQTGDAQSNTLTGTDGNDILRGLAGNDTLVSGAGNDLMIGGAGADTFDLTGGYNHIRDYEANLDQIYIDSSAYGGSDPTIDFLGNVRGGQVTSYQSQFTATGQRIYTVVNGAEVNIAFIEGATAANPLQLSDVLFRQTGDAQANTLTGGANRDILLGGGGADTLVSGAGNDYLVGGAGADTFVLTGGKNHIADYTRGVDTIQIDSSEYGGATSIQSQQLGTAQRIYALVNGAEVDIAVIEGITPATALTNSDFVFV